MSDNDLFNEDGTPKVEGTPAPVVTPPAGIENSNAYLGLILNEQGEQKYANIEEALKGSVHAQTHISTLEKELKELREKTDDGKSMADLLEALEKKGKPDEATPQVGITPEQLSEQVTSLLDNRDIVQTQKNNTATVVNKFRELYGEKASETLYGKAKDLGFDQNGINSLIATNPTAAMRLLAPEVPHKPADPSITPGQNIQNIDGKPVEPPETIMGATSHKDLSRSWEASKAATLKRLGIDELT